MSFDVLEAGPRTQSPGGQPNFSFFTGTSFGCRRAMFGNGDLFVRFNLLGQFGQMLLLRKHPTVLLPSNVPPAFRPVLD
jgi:hypothetical protein